MLFFRDIYSFKSQNRHENNSKYDKKNNKQTEQADTQIYYHFHPLPCNTKFPFFKLFSSLFGCPEATESPIDALKTIKSTEEQSKSVPEVRLSSGNINDNEEKGDSVKNDGTEALGNPTESQDLQSESESDQIKSSDSDSDIDDENNVNEDLENLRSILIILQKILLLVAVITFLFIVIYSAYYINILRKIYSKDIPTNECNKNK